VSPDIPTKHLK